MCIRDKKNDKKYDKNRQKSSFRPKKNLDISKF